ncbi:MAG TPA: SDR family NAD(P)-dependent oxidoreductase [Spirochaetota bacterium]|nr:SDR family NAD(P)-dependent oxidoreductase [Spirochaetota bacterium]HPI23960.1 SDR family NAD(P)-dependent oxidoreductase [Spirochaetota bacterium]HPU87455.1 SDR family NAD(P)-dependent oxidoreductase [Spirochaetota bacterium]
MPSAERGSRLHDGKRAETRPTALITGGSSGIGKELARLFHRAGYRVLIAALDRTELAQTKRELLAAGNDTRIDTLTLDLSRQGAAARIVRWTRSLGAEVDVLVNNAGFGLWGQAVELPLPEVRSMLAVNITAATELCHAIGGLMKARGRGSILNVASTASFQPVPYMAAYAASKCYLASFTAALAAELRPFGVAVSILHPGTTRTNFLSRAGINPGSRASLGGLAHAIAMDPADVAAAGFAAVLHGRRRAIPGALNRLQFLATRLLPGFAIMAMAKKIFKKP